MIHVILNPHCPHFHCYKEMKIALDISDNIKNKIEKYKNCFEIFCDYFQYADNKQDNKNKQNRQHPQPLSLSISISI